MKLKVPPVVVLIFSVGLMWLVDRYFIIDPFIFEGLQYVSIGIMAAGILWGMMALWEFYRSSTTIDPHNVEKVSTLVDSGIYRISRNPMYVGLVFLLVAVAFYLGNLLSLLVLPLFIWYMNRYQIMPEEQMMEEKFGEEYRTYKNEVRRWL